MLMKEDLRGAGGGKNKKRNTLYRVKKNIGRKRKRTVGTALLIRFLGEKHRSFIGGSLLGNHRCLDNNDYAIKFSYTLLVSCFDGGELSFESLKRKPLIKSILEISVSTSNQLLLRKLWCQ